MKRWSLKIAIEEPGFRGGNMKAYCDTVLSLIQKTNSVLKMAQKGKSLHPSALLNSFRNKYPVCTFYYVYTC